MSCEYMLPRWDFVGGSAQRRSFQFTKESGQEYNMKNGVVFCSVQDYANGGRPVISKQFPLYASVDGNFCITTVVLNPAETKDLFGCYVYQLTIKDSYGNIAIPFHGLMHIAQNIEPELLS